MKRIAIALFLVCLSLLTHAQKHEIGIEAGANTFSFLKSGLTDYYKKIPGYQQGITYQYNVKQRSSFTASVWYLKKGYRFDEGMGLEPQSPYTDTYVNYLAIPLAYKYKFTKCRLQPSIQIGFIPAVLFSSVITKYENFDNTMNRGRAFLYKDNVWHMDITAGAGLDYKITEQFKVEFNFKYAFTFAFINKETTASNVFTHTAFPFPNAYLYNLSLRYIIKKKE
jgi:hypothetical protein